MSRSPSPPWLAVPAALVAALVVTPGPARPDPPAAAEADAAVPVAAPFQTLDTTLTVGDATIAVTLGYSVQKTTVFVLPVWAVVGPVERRCGADPVRQACPPAGPLVPAGERGDVRVEFAVKDLSADEKVWDAVRGKLRERIAADRGRKGQEVEYEFARPHIKDGSYTASLAADGTGDERLPAEVAVSNEVRLLPGGRVRLDLDRAALTLLETETGRPLPLAGVRLRVTGLMRQRFDTVQFAGGVTAVRAAVDTLRKRVSSAAPAGSAAAEVLVAVPAGGGVDSTNAVESALRSSLTVELRTREGAAASPVLGLLQDALKGVLRQQELNTADDKRRVAVLLGGQVTVAATVGEIKALARVAAADRTDKFRAALDDADARRTGKASAYAGALKVGTLVGPVPVAGEASGSAKFDEREDVESRRKREVESLQQGFDQLAKHFSGSVPTLTGIAFDDRATREAFEQVEQRFSHATFTVDYGPYRWPPVPLAASADPAVSPRLLAEQYAQTRDELDRTRGLLGTADRLARARGDVDDLEKALTRLAKLEVRLTAQAAAADKRVSDAAASVDVAELKRLRASLDALTRRLGERAFSPREADFADAAAGLPPPGLDCTAGVGAYTARAAQAAWAAHHKAKVREEYTVGTGVTVAFCVVPKAVYNRGGTEKEDEGPVRAVTISRAFAAGETEVSQGQWKAVMGADDNPSTFRGDDLPVESVTRQRAEEFCAKLGKLIGRPVRLPTEAEWELACRAGTTSHYSLGDTISDARANYDATASFARSPAGEARQRTVGVREFRPNAWGLYGMHGNVWEWCADDYAEVVPAGDTASAVDPKVAVEKPDRSACRGGSWFDGPVNCRSANRGWITAGGFNNRVGFRVVFTLE